MKMKSMLINCTGIPLAWRSWVEKSRVISTLDKVMIVGTTLAAFLMATHEPPRNFTIGFPFVDSHSFCALKGSFGRP